MIEAPTLSERTPSLTAMLVRRRHPPAPAASPSRVPVAVEPETRARGWAADLRFFAICYLAGFIFFLIMLS